MVLDEFLYFIGILLLTTWLFFFLLSLAIDFFDFRFPKKRIIAEMYQCKVRLRKEAMKDKPNAKKIEKYENELRLLEIDLCLYKSVEKQARKEKKNDKN